jgi:hypothetical protein
MSNIFLETLDSVMSDNPCSLQPGSFIRKAMKETQ